MTEEQVKNDKERAQDQIVWNTMLFIIVAFVLGYLLQFVPIIPQGIFTILTGFIAFSLVEKRVKSAMNDAFQKTELFLKEKYDIEEFVDNQIKDFLSLVHQKVGYHSLSEEPFIQRQPALRGSLKREDMEERTISFENSCTCVKELLYFNEDNGKKEELIKSIVIDALKPFVPEHDPRYKEVRKRLYAYLRAWLVCSIRYKTSNLPIEWIQGTALNKQEQIKVIDYIINNILKEKDIEDFLCEGSIEEVSKYLKILIKKIKQSV
ncbi:hypothetical protein LC612_28925 [Nostoc sp. CHAB 5834]|nr:hypothetical protein [Nostoc sp. CHAB 5834]